MMGGTKRWQWLVAIILSGIILYGLLIFNSPAPLKEHRSSTAASYEQLTIVMNTYKRHDLMLGTTSLSEYNHCTSFKYNLTIQSP